MSADAMADCWGQMDGLTAAQKVVLLKVADVVNDVHDYEFWAYSKWVARKVGMEPRNTRKRLAELCDAGWLKVLEVHAGDRTKYQWLGCPKGRVEATQPPGSVDPTPGSTDPTDTSLSITQPTEPEAQAPAVIANEAAGVLAVPPGESSRSVARTSQAPTRTTRVEIQGMHRIVPCDFDGFWSLYPRPVGKIAARKAWDKALKLPDVTPERILATVAAWVPSWLKLEDEKFIPHPTTWLNRGGWDDVPDHLVEQSRRALQNHQAQEREAAGLGLWGDDA